MICPNCENVINSICENCGYGITKIYINNKEYDATECDYCECGNIIFPGHTCNCGKLSDIQKLKIFEYYLNKIETTSIKEFTKFALLRLPEYFYTLPASTSGKYHGENETLIDHVLSCLTIGEFMCEEELSFIWTQKQKDQLYSALILHDGWRCGAAGSEEYYTEENTTNKNLIGKLRTCRDHPEIGFRNLLILAGQYNKIAEENKVDKIGIKNFEAIAKAVRLHSGPFFKIKDVEFSLDYPYSSLTIQVHLIDFMQTKMAMLKRGKNV